MTERDNKKKYSYEQVWSETKIDSSRFHKWQSHSNPHNLWPFESHSFIAKAVTIGKFHLQPDLIAKLGKNLTQQISMSS